MLLSLFLFFLDLFRDRYCILPRVRTKFLDGKVDSPRLASDGYIYTYPHIPSRAGAVVGGDGYGGGGGGGGATALCFVGLVGWLVRRALDCHAAFGLSAAVPIPLLFGFR